MKKEKEEVYINLMQDFAFKTLWVLGSKESQKWLKKIVKEITHIDVEEYHLGMNEIGSYTYQSIFNRVDILLYSKDNNHILDIELNKKYSKVLVNKNNSYILKLAGNQYAGLSKEEIYQNDIHAVQLNLNAFHNPVQSEVGISQSFFYDKKHDIKRMQVEIYDVYLPLCRKICYDEDIKKDLGMFFCKSYEEMETLVEKDKGRKAIMEDLKKLGTDREFVEYYDKDLFNAALQYEEYNNGVEQTKKEDAINLHKKGVLDDIIVDALNITKEQLQEYLQQDASQ